ncbi:thymidylate synthase [Limibacillus sp. MBR-115]|jgi:thymidylate synthase|uniref:thymidylate synthase n=1 Tax=Limibacillus sp. MBR-115 TaxID=3156465 RepID=UPI003391D6D4
MKNKHLRAKTLDDLLRKIFRSLLSSKSRSEPTKGHNRDAIGVFLELSQPRCRVSQTETKGTIFSCIGELLWYLARSNELAFIQYYIPKYKEYSDDGKTIWGAYGPRIFDWHGTNQFQRVADRLKVNRHSRRAVIQLFDSYDLNEPHEDVPCTTTLQFIIRDDLLHMVVHMRSNDAFKGLPHDIFSFTMLQELLSNELSVKLGSYHHSVGNLHLYEEDFAKAKKFLSEGWQSSTPMPAMPFHDNWASIGTLLDVERQIREGQYVDFELLDLPPYWADLARLLRIYAITKDQNEVSVASRRELVRLKQAMSTDIYDLYIRKKDVRINVITKQDQFVFDR